MVKICGLDTCLLYEREHIDTVLCSQKKSRGWYAIEMQQVVIDLLNLDDETVLVCAWFYTDRFRVCGLEIQGTHIMFHLDK